MTQFDLVTSYKDRIEESISGVDCLICPGSGAGNIYNVDLRIQDGAWAITIRFFEDHVRISQSLQSMLGPYGDGECDQIDDECDVSYNDPNFMDTLLSELKKQIRKHNLRDPPQRKLLFCLAQLCRDKLSESYQADYTINDRWQLNHKIELRVQKTTILRRLLSESEKWLMTVRFLKDYVMISSRRRNPLDATICEELEVSYSDPKFMGILLSELRWVW